MHNVSKVIRIAEVHRVTLWGASMPTEHVLVCQGVSVSTASERLIRCIRALSSRATAKVDAR